MPQPTPEGTTGAVPADPHPEHPENPENPGNPENLENPGNPPLGEVTDPTADRTPGARPDRPGAGPRRRWPGSPTVVLVAVLAAVGLLVVGWPPVSHPDPLVPGDPVHLGDGVWVPTVVSRSAPDPDRLDVAPPVEHDAVLAAAWAAASTVSGLDPGCCPALLVSSSPAGGPLPAGTVILSVEGETPTLMRLREAAARSPRVVLEVAGLAGSGTRTVVVDATALAPLVVLPTHTGATPPWTPPVPADLRGGSWGLGAAVWMLVQAGRLEPPETPVAVTGQITPDGTVEAVAATDIKMLSAQRVPRPPGVTIRFVHPVTSPPADGPRDGVIPVPVRHLSEIPGLWGNPPAPPDPGS